MRHSPPQAANRIFDGRHVAVVAAHPDDEVIGFGGQMATVRRLSLIHLTEGVPSCRTARAHGFATAEQSAGARRNEMEAAVRLGGVPADWEQFKLPDGLVALHLKAATARLATLLDALTPDVVLTHPYEGGHPDHDAAAFITARAMCRLGRPAQHWEMTSYHRGPDGLRTGAFLDEAAPIWVSRPAADAHLKRAMLACFTSQRVTLIPFGSDEERFRPAPRYDFRQAPHAGRLLYENRRRAMRGVMWRRLARDAMEAEQRPWSSLRQAIERAGLRIWLKA